jgi:hypothetical protein
MLLSLLLLLLLLLLTSLFSDIPPVYGGVAAEAAGERASTSACAFCRWNLRFNAKEFLRFDVIGVHLPGEHHDFVPFYLCVRTL